ncbi:MAG: FHA domain-containing protein, partial [Muribaculaceae bacterium]|nr:FHA domain-containing protein [Muribaculaceae bacterium]
MKYIECPECFEDIPEDSRYCDMCGVELLECVNCHSIGTGVFCSECGRPMISRSMPAEDAPEPPEWNDHPATDTTDGTNIGTTIGGRSRNLVLKARKGGFILTPEDGAVIGRTEGEYSSLLGSCNLISRRHGKFLKLGRDWHLVDLGSTNGCLINDVELKPMVPTKFKAGDVVDIGTYI